MRQIEIAGTSWNRRALFDREQEIVAFQMLTELAIETMNAIERVLLLAQDKVELGVVDILVPGQRLQRGVLAFQVKEDVEFILSRCTL